jgi:ankyrin repeat protein
LQSRGVSLQWLVRFIRQLQQDINGGREMPRTALLGFGDRIPYSFLTTHSLVGQIVHPLTKPTQAPLYALVPEAYRGTPDVFVSHTWTSLLVGPALQRIGSLDALEPLGNKFVWIDFVSYNQHTFKSVIKDMRAVIEKAGRLVVSSTPIPIYCRSWCLWELFCAMKVGVPVELAVCRGYRNDKILSVNALYRSFTGINAARSSNATDQQAIYQAFLDQYGTEEQANAAIEKLIRDQFSHRWYELQTGSADLTFSPTPWVADTEGTTRERTQPFFLPGLLDSEDFHSGRTIRQVFADAGVYLAQKDQLAVELGKAEQALQAANVDYRDFYSAILTGDARAVELGIRAGIDVTKALTPDSPTPLGLAISGGFPDVVRLLLAAGADPNATIGRGSTALSMAVDKKYREIVHMLLDGGAAVDAEEGDGRTPLVWAAERGDEHTVAALLDRGADLNHIVRSNGATALHVAAQEQHEKVVELLLARGARVNLRTASGNTPLHFAAYAGNTKIAALLLQHGADPKVVNRAKKTPRDVAGERGHVGVVQMMGG